MSGQCYGCGTEFSFFKKEHGCKNCGFSFCSACLPKKTAVPKLDNTKHHVCNRCFDILTGKTQVQDTGRHSPPAAYIKRLEALQHQDSKSKEKPKSPGAALHPHTNYAGLGKKDREIAQRLEKLKERPKEQHVSDKDLNQRLARLKGEEPAVRTAPTKPVYQPPDRRTQTEQIDDLLDEIATEVEIDSHYPDPAKDVANRLARLRKDESGASQDEQNNLDKNDLSPQKVFVKNIDVSGSAHKNVAGTNRGSQAQGEGEVDFTEVQDLMTRAAQQMEQEAQQALEGMKKDKQLMERLAEIKKRQKQEDKAAKSDKQSTDSNVDNLRVNDQDDDSEDEETAAKRVMQQFLEEVKLDQRLGEVSSADQDSDSRTGKKTGKSKSKTKKNPQAQKEQGDDDDDDEEYEDPDELPFCCICTEDAVIRCRDCDMDLYCDRCFRDGHKELGLEGHRTSPYKAPKGYR